MVGETEVEKQRGGRREKCEKGKRPRAFELRWHTIMYHSDDPIVSYGVSKYKSGFTVVRGS